MKALRIYLEKIKEGKNINYDQFLKKLPDEYRLSEAILFETELISTNPKRWSVICSTEVLSELWLLSEVPKNRVHATKLGNSHNHRVSANLVMVYHQELPDSRPSVVYVSRHEIVQSFNSKSTLLLVENEENFIQFDLFCQNLSQLIGKQLSVKTIDIALGGGKRGTSNFLMKWYSQYDEILCAFDYDLGGLEMFKALKNSLKDKVIFVQPLSYTSISPLFVKSPDSGEKLNNAMELAKHLGFEELHDTFFETRHFMEQEVLLEEN